jgi:hypothetical protein
VSAVPMTSPSPFPPDTTPPTRPQGFRISAP